MDLRVSLDIHDMYITLVKGNQGAGRMALETQGSREHDLKLGREQENRDLETGSKCMHA